MLRTMHVLFLTALAITVGANVSLRDESRDSTTVEFFEIQQTVNLTDGQAFHAEPRQVSSPSYFSKRDHAPVQGLKLICAGHHPHPGPDWRATLFGCFGFVFIGHEDTEPEPSTISLMTLNCGTWRKIMNDQGEPTEDFLLLIDDNRGPLVFFLNEVHLQHSDPQWKKFKVKLEAARPLLRVARICGPSGTALIHSAAMPHPYSYEIDETLGENTVTLVLRWTQGHRLLIRGVYFPFNEKDRALITRTLHTIEGRSGIKEDEQIIIGDLNSSGKSHFFFSDVFTRCRLQRKNTPPTGFSTAHDSHITAFVGQAQQIWCSPRVDISNVIVDRSYTRTLSNHHCPVLCTLTLRDTKGTDIIRPPSIKSERRHIPAGKEARLGAQMEHATDLASLQAIMKEGTTPTASMGGEFRKQGNQHRHQEKRFYARKGTPNGLSRPARPKHKQAVWSAKERIRKRMLKQRGRVLKLAQDDPKRLARETFKSTVQPIECENANAVFADALKTFSWLKAESTNDIGEDIPQIVKDTVADLADMLEAAYTPAECNEARNYLHHKVTYSDYALQIAILMGPNALRVLADQFTLWSKDPDRKIDLDLIAIPTGKVNEETECKRYLQRALRPIGIQSLINAWYNAAQQARFAKIATALASPNMYGFLKGREGHEMITQTLLRIEHANRSENAFWVAKCDNVKCFDRLAHSAIAQLDSFTGETSIFTVVASQINGTTMRVRATEGTPCEVTTDVGGPQGDARLPALWNMLASGVNYKMDEYARQKDPSRLVESASIFADDSIFTSRSLEGLMGLFELARKQFKDQGQDLTIVTIARNGFTWEPPGEVITEHVYEGKTYPIKPSLRILGACVHVVDSEPHRKRRGHDDTTPGCADALCKTCPKTSPRKMCDECIQMKLEQARALNLPILDVVRFVNDYVITSAMYGVYSCTKHQEWTCRLEKTFRGPLTAPPNGGYITGMHLKATMGGAGVIDTNRRMAIDTAEIFDRIFSREGRTRDVAMEYFTHHSTWPYPITQALKRDEDFKMEVKRHPALVARSEQRDPPRAAVQWKLEDNGDFYRILATTHTTHTNRPKVSHSSYEVKMEKHKMHDKEIKSIRLIATVLDAPFFFPMKCGSVKSITAYPKYAREELERYAKDTSRHKFRNRSYIDVLHRTRIAEQEDDWFTPEPDNRTLVQKDRKVIAAAIHQRAKETPWEDAHLVPERLPRDRALAFLRLCFPTTWFTGNLEWNRKTKKKNMVQGQLRRRRPEIDNTCYMECEGITVVDIDDTSEISSRLLDSIGNRCNLVAKTRKGIHLYFSGNTPEFRGAQLVGADIRTGGGGDEFKPDIIYACPSYYNIRDEVVHYDWLAMPNATSPVLMPLPKEALETLLKYRADKAHQTACQAEPTHMPKVRALAIPSEPPLSFPFSIHLGMTTSAITHTARSLKERLELIQLQEHEQANQPAEWKRVMPHIDHELSAITAGSQKGIHFFSTLQPGDADTLLRLRTGGLLKTNALPNCEHPLCKGKFIAASVAHIMTHVSPDAEYSVRTICDDFNEDPDVIVTIPDVMPYPMWLGFISKTTIVAKKAGDPTQEKRIKQIARTLATHCAEFGLEAYKLCVPRHPFEPPRPTTAEIQAQKVVSQIPLPPRHPDTQLARTDASIRTVSGGVSVGIGGFIQDQQGNYLYTFMVRIRMDQCSSQIGEYLGSLIVASAAKRLSQRMEFEGDNKQVVENTIGKAKTSDTRATRIRARIHMLLKDMDGMHTWIPREKNVVADDLSKQAHIDENRTIHPEDLEVLTYALVAIFGPGAEK